MADLMKHACFTLSTDEIYLKQDNLNISFLNGEWVIEICMNRDNEEVPFAESGIYLCKDTPTGKRIFVTSRTSIMLCNGIERETTEFESCFDSKISSSNIWSLPTAVFKGYVSCMECYRSFLKIELWFSGRTQKQDIQELKEGPLSCLNRVPSGIEHLSLDFSKLLRDEFNTDVVLKVEDRKINVHKLVLSARSDVFRAMFQHNMFETATNTVDIKDFDKEVMDIFLEYLYTGRFPQTTVDVIFDLYRIADKYVVGELKKRCSFILACGLSQETACHILKLADSHSDKTLKERAVEYVLENDEILSSNEWGSLSDEQPKLAVEVYKAFFGRINQQKTLKLPVKITIRKTVPTNDRSTLNSSTS